MLNAMEKLGWYVNKSFFQIFGIEEVVLYESSSKEPIFCKGPTKRNHKKPSCFLPHASA